MCRTHNALLAEQDFGKEKMARYRRRSRDDSKAAGGVMVHGPCVDGGQGVKGTGGRSREGAVP